MNWLNIHTDTLRSQEFLGAEPVERATWLALLGWCATQENSGVIQGAKSWTDRRWQQTCGVTKAEADTKSELFLFEGESLVVSFYPVEKQAEVVAKREAGKRGGRPRKPLETQGEKPSGLPCGSAEVNHEAMQSESEAETEWKGMEGKGMEGEENEKKTYYTEAEGLVIPQDFLDKMIQTYLKINVANQIKGMEGWLLANPKKRKKNYESFINNWLSRADKDAPSAGGQPILF